MEDARGGAREGLACFLAVPFAHVPLGLVNAEGLDATIVALCA